MKEANELAEIWDEYRAAMGVYYRYNKSEFHRERFLFYSDNEKHILRFWHLKAKIDEGRRIRANQSKIIMVLNEQIEVMKKQIKNLEYNK